MISQPSTSSNEAPIFIVGPSRSGTAMVRSILNNHPSILVSGESHYFDDLRLRMKGRLRGPLAADDRRTCEDYFLALDHRPYGHQGDPAMSDMSRDELRAVAQERGDGADAYFEAFCIVRARREGKERWGDKTPRHVFRIPEILEAYPAAKVLCMVRDPRAVVASYRDWRNQGGFDLERDPGHADALAAEEARVRRSYNPLLISLLWRSTVRAALAARERFGEARVRIQPYEQLVTQPEDEIRHVCQWLGVAFEDQMLQIPMLNSSFSTFAEGRGVSREAVDRWQSKLTSTETAIVQSCCRGDMDRVGYESLTTAAPAWRVWRAWATLPVAAGRAATVNRSRMGNMPRYIMRRIQLAFAH